MEKELNVVFRKFKIKCKCVNVTLFNLCKKLQTKWKFVHWIRKLMLNLTYICMQIFAYFILYL